MQKQILQVFTLIIIQFLQLSKMKLVQKLYKIVQIQKKRYQKKGTKNTLLGLALMFGIFGFAHTFGKYTWSQQEVKDKQKFIMFWAMVIHTCTQAFLALCYLPGYLGADVYKQFEINKQLKWPWQKEDWSEIRKGIFSRYLLNHLVVFPVLMFTLTSMGTKLQFTGFPSFLQFFLQVQFCFICDDFTFYIIHRACHESKALYKIHKIHHQQKKIFIMSRDDFHWIDMIFGTITFSSGLVLLGSRVHCFTYFFWIIWKMTIGTQNHSGYEFPWSPVRVLPLVCGSSFHDHHHSVNIGNFGLSSYFWDLMCETGDNYMNQFLGYPKQNAKLKQK